MATYHFDLNASCAWLEIGLLISDALLTEFFAKGLCLLQQGVAFRLYRSPLCLVAIERHENELNVVLLELALIVADQRLLDCSQFVLHCHLRRQLLQTLYLALVHAVH